MPYDDLMPPERPRGWVASDPPPLVPASQRPHTPRQGVLCNASAVTMAASLAALPFALPVAGVAALAGIAVGGILTMAARSTYWEPR